MYTNVVRSSNRPKFTIKVVDTTENYVNLMTKLFDFPKLKNLIARKDFNFIFDGMSGIAGPYAVKIFHEILGSNSDNLLNCVPKEDFGGGHPDPNLTYAHTLVHKLDVFHEVTQKNLMCIA